MISSQLRTILFSLPAGKKRRQRDLFSFFKCFFIFLLLESFLLDPALCRYVWLVHHRDMVKKEVEKKIKSGGNEPELVLLQFTREEVKTKLKWRSWQEFEYNGQLYDIVNTKTDEHNISYWCLPDEKEKRLEDKIKEVVVQVGKQKEDNLYNPNFLSSWLKHYLLMFSSPWPLPSLAFLARLSFSLDQNYTSFLFPPPEPPPRLLS